MPPDRGIAALLATARAALPRHGIDPGATVRLLGLSENATFVVDAADDRSVLRVCRAGYHSDAALHAELDWIDALRRDGVVATPAVLTAPDGARVVTAAHPDGAPRRTVRFEWVDGVEPALDALAPNRFRVLGEIAARMHEHAARWCPPAGFERFTWNHATALGPAGHWGDWRRGVGVGAPEQVVLQRLSDEIGRRLDEFGCGPDRFGLVHADMRLANLLIGPDGTVHVIDFDDCGFSWFGYDLAASLSFVEHEPVVPELVGAWFDGYREVTPRGVVEEALAGTFLMLRRLLLVAWLGSHPEADLAAELGAEFTDRTVAMARRYLRGHTPWG